MKTVTVNLIDNSDKTSKSKAVKVRKTSSEVKGQIFGFIALLCVLIVFAACFGGWIFMKKQTSDMEKKLVKFNKELDELRQEEARLSEYKDNLEKEKEVAEYKILVLNRLNNSFLPWSNVLKEISSKIPKDIIVSKIEKTGTSAQSEIFPILKISGMISARNKKIEPLTEISLFIFNINEEAEKENLLLSEAKISKLEFDEKTKIYEFEFETTVKNKK